MKAEGDCHKEIYSWKDHQGRNKTKRTEWESGKLSGEFMEWNTVERAIETEIDTRTEYKGVGKLGWFMSKHKPQHPHHVKVRPRGRLEKGSSFKELWWTAKPRWSLVWLRNKAILKHSVNCHKFLQLLTSLLTCQSWWQPWLPWIDRKASPWSWLLRWHQSPPHFPSSWWTSEETRMTCC